MVATAPQQKLTRKAREIREREELILSAAQSLINESGYNHLSMERVAERVEYSKGTIYNHFSSKEDLVCSLSCRYIGNLIDVFKRAYHYPGSTRERYLAIGLGYSLYHQLHPTDAQNIQLVKNHAIREKVSAEKLAEMEALEQKITDIALSIVQQAIDCGDLGKQHQDNISTIVFGCWSMHYGALLLEQSDIPLHELGFTPVVNMLWQNSNRYLDGYQWQPLTTPFNSTTLIEKISTALFDGEIKISKQTS
jgi:AcrR family transcriptional regulator